VISRDIADTVNPQEDSSEGFSHPLVALREVQGGLCDELAALDHDSDVRSGDVEPDSCAAPGSANAKMEHLVAKAEARLALVVDSVLADPEVLVELGLAGNSLPSCFVGGGRSEAVSRSMRSALLVVADDLVELDLELADGLGWLSLGQEPLSVWCQRSTLPQV
jgi:hypothetical protein